MPIRVFNYTHSIKMVQKGPVFYRIDSKEPYILSKEPYIQSKEPYILSKEPNILFKESYTLCKEPYIILKEPYTQRALHAIQRALCSLSKVLFSLTNGGGQKKRRQVPWAEWLATTRGTVERRTVACAAARFAPEHRQQYCQPYCQQRPIYHENSPMYSEKSPVL